jgi:anti-anti-sigma regulatory factor
MDRVEIRDDMGEQAISRNLGVASIIVGVNSADKRVVEELGLLLCKLFCASEIFQNHPGGT